MMSLSKNITQDELVNVLRTSVLYWENINKEKDKEYKLLKDELDNKITEYKKLDTFIVNNLTELVKEFPIKGPHDWELKKDMCVCEMIGYINSHMKCYKKELSDIVPIPYCYEIRDILYDIDKKRFTCYLYMYNNQGAFLRYTPKFMNNELIGVLYPYPCGVNGKEIEENDCNRSLFKTIDHIKKFDYKKLFNEKVLAEYRKYNIVTSIS
jgi:hypothetical protein